MTARKPRRFEIALDIDAPPEAVWAALTASPELTRWFATRADIDPREGGHYTLSWDGAWEWQTVITALEPGRRLVLTDRRGVPFTSDGQPMAGVAPETLAMEYTIDARGGRTRLRLVHSGFGPGAEWDDEFDGTSQGWNKELRSLRHYLERHRGADRRIAWTSVTVDTSLDEAWHRLTRPGGLVAGAPPSAHGGDNASLELATGDRLAGRVLWAQPDRGLLMTADSLGDGLFRLSLDRVAARTMIFLAVSAWGASADRVGPLFERARDALGAAVPV